jgi:ribonuclease BN (tRNA processing enzyme)
MMSDQFKAKFYGVRGSYPISPAGGTKIGGNTTCFMVRSKQHMIIFDAGSGIIQLGKELVPEILEHKNKSSEPFHITIAFTHTHSDHLMGLPFFAPLYIPGVHLHFIGPATLGQDIEEIISNLFLPQYYPVGIHEFQSEKSYYNINEANHIYFENGNPKPQIGLNTTPVNAETALNIKALKYYFHPKDGSFVYKTEWQDKEIVFATDIEEYAGCDQRLVDFASGADLLIHDAQYSPEQYKKFSGYGHSSTELACEAAKLANVKKLLLFHHDPGNDDDTLIKMEKEAQKIFSNTELATEQWEWVI